jgi:predicted nucleic acid-binding protein
MLHLFMELPFKRIYLDSNVFISLFNKEIGFDCRGLFVEAEHFFESARQSGAVLVLSDWFFRETERVCHTSKEQIIEYIEKKGIKTETVEKLERFVLRRFVGKGMHFSDASHAALAVTNHCDCIVTFNTRHFEPAASEIVILLPEEFT